MGRYDAERQQMGVTVTVGGTASSPSSRYAAERQAIFNPPSSTADWRRQEDSNTMPNFSLDTTTQQQPNNASVSAPQVPQPSTWDQIKAFDLKGLGNQAILGLEHGLANTGSSKMDTYMANAHATDPGVLGQFGRQTLINDQKRNAYLDANPVNSLPAQLGEMIPSIPLWAAGEGALGTLGKSLGKLVPALASTAEKVGSKLPGIVKGGLMDAGTYGGIVAPVETIQQGGNLQDLIDKEKQLPMVALGGVATRGLFKGIGEGVGATKSLIKPLGVPAEPFGPPQSLIPPVRSFQRGADLGPLKLSDTLTPEYKAKQAELNSLFKDAPIGTTTTPLATRTLQDGIDTSMGIGKPVGDYQGLDAFGKPLQSFKKSTDLQNNVDEISAQLDNQLKGYETMIKQADEQTPIGTIRKAIFDKGGIRQANDGIFEEKRVIPNWIRNDTTGMPLDQMADELKMTSDDLLKAVSDSKFVPKDYAKEALTMASKDPEYQANSSLLDTLKAQLPGKRTLDVIPKLKPRELTPKLEPLPIQPQRLTLSGSLPPVDAPFSPVKPLRGATPLKPISAEQTLTDALKGREKAPLKSPNAEITKVGDSANTPNVQTGKATWANKDVDQPVEVTGYAGNHNGVDYVTIKGSNSGVPLSEIRYDSTPLRSPTPLPKDTKVFWQSVSKELFAKGEQPPFTLEIMKKDIQSGKLDISKLSNEEEIRTLLGMDLQKFSQNAVPQSVIGSEPSIPAGLKERGVSENIRTDANRPDELPEPQSKIIIGKPKDKITFKDALKKFYVKVVNTQQPIYDVGKIAGSDVGKLASNTKSVSGIVDHNFLTSMVDKNGDVVGDSLKKTVEAIPKGQEEEFWTYMSQRHNIDRAREEFNMVPKTDKQGFTVNDKYGNPIMNKVVTKKPTPVQANYTPSMSEDAVKIAEQAHPEYKAVGDGIVKWLDDFMTTWGVDTGIVNKDIYASLRQTYKSYFPTQRDFSTLESAIPDGVASKFADQRTPIRKATGSERDIIDPIENIMNLVSKVVRTAKYNEVGQSLLDAVKSSPEKMKQFAEVIPVKDGMTANTDNVISVLVDGKAQYLQINDRMLLDAMNGLPKSINSVPVLTAVTNGIKGLITQKNPLFAIRNIARDIPTAYAYGSESNPLKFTSGLVGAGKDILTNSPRLQKYQAVGGGGANFFKSGDVTKSATELTGKINPIKNIALKPLKAIERFNNLTEAAPRLAEFNRVLDKTGDVTKALFAANDVTVNFSRGGNVTKNIDKMGGMYVNASFQGLDKFFRGFLSPKTAVATIVKSGVAITAPDLALYMVNKDDPNYQALDNRTKDAYFLIPKGNGEFWKVPKSRELGVLFGSLFERGLRAAEGQKNSFSGFSNSVATNFAPANPLESSLITPAIDIGKNKDFANRAIVPQGMLMDKRSNYLQYDDKTSSVAKTIGELTTNVPGLPGGLSPKILDYLVKSYSGVIGQIGIPLLVPGGSPLKAMKTQFTADPTFSNQATTDYYDKLNKLSAAAVDKNIIEKIPGKKLTPEEDMRNSMNGVGTALSRGTKLINKIQSSSDPLKDDKIKIIKDQMLILTNKAVSADTPKLMQSVENNSKKLFLK